MTKRFRWILLGLIVGLVTGGVAYAVVVNPPNSGDRYYACVSSAGVVNPKTIKLNVEPTSCPIATDVVHSWNAIGPTGPTGNLGATGPTGATGPGPDVVRTTTIRVSDQPYTIPQNGVGALLGPVDVSACRSYTVNVAGHRAQSVRIYAYDPESGRSVFRTLWSNRSGTNPNQGDAGVVINQGPSYSGYQGGSYWGEVQDTGGASPATVKMDLVGDPSIATGVANHIWLDCIPW